MMSHSEISTPISECGSHIRVKYHERPMTPTTSVESLFNGTASESCSSLTLTSTSSSITRTLTRSNENLATVSQAVSHESDKQTSPYSGLTEKVADSAADLTLRNTIMIDADAPPRAYTLRVPKNMGQRTLFIEKPSPIQGFEHERTFSRLKKSYKRVESVVSSFSLGICLILHQPMIRPQRTQCGHYFCRDCITKRQKKDKTCPCCGERVALDKLEAVGPLELKPTLQGWKVVERQPKEEQSGQQS